MVRPVQYRRLWLLAILLLIAYAGLGYRLVDLQVVRHEALLERQQRATTRTVLREPRRGDIRDIRGNLLATSRFVKTVCADPFLIGTNSSLFVNQLAPLLQMEPEQIRQKLQSLCYTNQLGRLVEDHHVVLKRRVDEETWGRIQGAVTNLVFGPLDKPSVKKLKDYYDGLRKRAIYPEPWEDQVRLYPNTNSAAHVLGYTGSYERTTPQGAVTETAGRDGIERTLNSVLRGVAGWRRTEIDSRRRELLNARTQDIAPRSGLNVVLTLDIGLQNIVENELEEAYRVHQPSSVCAIAVRPRTGEILALANFPTFSPLQPGRVPMEWLRNRAIADTVEPGSTFKIVVVSGALNDGLVGLNDVFYCEQGAFVFAGRTLHDHHPYGNLRVEEIIAKSSNIGAAKIGIRMGSERLYQHIRNYGFGEATGIPLPGEEPGKVHPLPAWTKLSISRIPMGHEVTVTPLQIVMAMSSLANQGRLMRPMLVSRLEDESGRVVAQYRPQVVRQVVQEEAVRRMLTALTSVVSTNGTGKAARLEHYAVAGKTGTAEKYKPGNYYLASFIGFFPVEQPEILIGVFLDEPKGPHTGGEVAAPVFRRIGERAATYFCLRPSFLPETRTASSSDRWLRQSHDPAMAAAGSLPQR